MHQAVRSAEIHKGAKVTQAADNALAYLALMEIIQQAILLILTPLPHGRPLRKDQAVAPPVELNDLEHQVLAHQLAQALDALLVGIRAPQAHAGDLRRGHKAPHAANAHNHPAAVAAGDGALEHFL